MNGVTLAADDDASVVAANKPSFRQRPFPVVLLTIGHTLTTEALDLGVRGLASMVDDFKAHSGDDPR